MRAAVEGKVIRIRDPNAVRPWQHVLNPLGGYLVLAQALAASPDAAGGWNFGPGDEAVRPVCELRWQVDPGPHPHEAGYLALDSSKARHELGWVPGWGLEEALSSIVAWYGLLRAGADMRRATLEQIDTFRAHASTLHSP
jgi:CDP-glucose 4,6-dehydratase